MTLEDIDQVAEIEAEGLSAWSCRSLNDELLWDCGQRLVAESWSVNGIQQILGWCASRTICQEAELLKITVRLQARRQGVGSLLLCRLLEILGKEGVHRLFFEVRSRNSRAIAFYKNAGCVIIGKRPRYYSNPKDDALLYQLAIAESMSSSV